MPSPLSSQTNSSGIGSPLVGDVAGGVDRAGRGRVVGRGVAEAASPRSRRAATRSATPSLRARSIANATPTARGRCEAIVEVCGITARSWWPKTLCRPPAIGSSVDATSPSSTSRSRRRAGHLRGAREVERAGAVVQQRRVGRPQRRGDGRVRLVARRPDRVEAAAGCAQPARLDVEHPAAELRVEQRERQRPGQPAARRAPAAPGRACGRAARPRDRARGSAGRAPLRA